MSRSKLFVFVIVLIFALPVTALQAGKRDVKPSALADKSTAPATTQAAASTAPIKYDSETFAGLDARNLGPGTMSGRVAAMDAVHEKNGRITLYVGAGAGGVWKSMNGGTTFKPVFDKYNQSIGAVAIDPNDHNTVWVGTGESWVRNSVSLGDGIYKTSDGGDTWTKTGLADSEHISRILIDPKDSNTVYVCAVGHLWDSNAERGVYKTTDGGKKWDKVLSVNDDTGCAMIAMDPQETHTLYAGMWQARRKAWTFTSGGPGSGFYKSTDAGATWKKMTNGLPTGDLGRIGVAVAASRPSTIYAIVEAKQTGLYRTDDGGENWRKINTSAGVIGRPFYFANLYVDPTDYNRVYKLATSLWVSEDGGKTFSGIGGSTHSDHHAFWIDPVDTNHLYTGNDGGVYESMDRGTMWRFFPNLAVGQFYHVAHDTDMPYNLYGGLQDNSSWVGPSRGVNGIYNRDWRSVFGGDGFWAFPDPTDNEYVYAESQGGNVGRINRKTLEVKNIKPLPRSNEKLRFNWNTPIVPSPTQKGTIYIGAQFLFRSRDHGESWERVSPDLTTNNPEKQKQEESGGLSIDNSTAENNNTIFSISESPKNSAVIWVGTDDGNVQVTHDSGKTWSNVTANLIGIAKDAWISTVEASRFDPAEAFVTVDMHWTGDNTTHVLHTLDYGKTWTTLATPDLTGYAHVIRQDLVNKDLLFLGTETGLYISSDAGKQWAKFTGGNFPPVAVRDINIMPRENDLLIATHGRGLWIVDDITPLRALTAEMLDKDAGLVAGRPQALTIPGNEFTFNGDADFLAPTAPIGAVITYYQKKRHIFGDLKFEIYDPTGKLVSSVPGNKRRGLSHIVWSMRSKGPKLPPATELVPNAFALQGPRVMPGTYTVKMIKDKDTFQGELKLVLDPRARYTIEDRKAQYTLVTRLYDMLTHLTYVADVINDARTQANDRKSKLLEGDATIKTIEEFVKGIDAIRGKLAAISLTNGITGQERIREQMGDLYGSVNGNEGRPTQSQVERTASLTVELDGVLAEFGSYSAKQLPALNDALGKAKLDPVKLMSKEDWDKKQEKETKGATVDLNSSAFSTVDLRFR